MIKTQQRKGLNDHQYYGYLTTCIC